MFYLYSPSIYILIPHDNSASLNNYQQQLLADTDYLQAAESYLESPLSDPAFSHFDRGLMRAFTGIPRVESPKKALGNKRIFELRIYQSHNHLKAQKKIEMFKADQRWNTLRKLETYKDTVSNITDFILRPARCSQI